MVLILDWRSERKYCRIKLSFAGRSGANSNYGVPDQATCLDCIAMAPSHYLAPDMALGQRESTVFGVSIDTMCRVTELIYMSLLLPRTADWCVK